MNFKTRYPPSLPLPFDIVLFDKNRDVVEGLGRRICGREGVSVMSLDVRHLPHDVEALVSPSTRASSSTAG